MIGNGVVSVLVTTATQHFKYIPYKRKGNAEKEYTKPGTSPEVIQYNTELSDKVLKWFTRSRHISTNFRLR